MEEITLLSAAQGTLIKTIDSLSEDLSILYLRKSGHGGI